LNPPDWEVELPTRGEWESWRPDEAISIAHLPQKGSWIEWYAGTGVSKYST